MKTIDIIKIMNPAQVEAVFTVDGPLLVFAGAGSGKTRVLTYRTTYIFEHKKIDPSHILAITFTNKAAKEMKERIEKLIGEDSKSMWITTFHSMCARILRKHAHSIGYKNNFSIYDTDDSKLLIQKILKYKSYQKIFLPKDVLSFVSSLKTKGIRAKEYFATTNTEEKLKEIYTEYDEELFKNNAFDFDDLLIKVVQLFREYPTVLDEYQELFQYIMVDEYQDTNEIQFILISMLAEKYKNICVVGDDDQSIYSFRGANIKNILDFQKYYPDAKIIKLEENYRSSSNILNTANAVIKNNKVRSIKSLTTTRSPGKKVYYQNYKTATTEANSVVLEILHKLYDYRDVAILYRTNAQSRLLEESCIKHNLPYRIIGGLNFYKRKEIKDLIAYLKIIANPSDAVSVKRIINTPKRNIGDTTVSKIETYAKSKGITLYKALLQVEDIPSISKKAVSATCDFMNTIEEYRYKLTKSGVLDISGDNSYSIHEYLNDILYKIGYLAELENLNDSETYKNKEENIEELMSKVIEFEESEKTFKLDKFLEEIALVSGVDIETEIERITLMTLHSAKGLEFKKVYIVGMEEGLFPSINSIIENNVEEERRLCYVGITRAIDELIITSASERMINGRIQKTKPSRFINEMPDKYIQKIYSV
ncbi:ATP-dependent helicase [Lacrimispora amygdalina]|uniref:ATP-dependent helicase n=1 Tax=Lacrimispora amygdalina TaxID=253257 RepID=UPI00140DDE57|nr:UvrD-helicase domain-containing protein [Lacrimispora amygdalina]